MGGKGSGGHNRKSAAQRKVEGNAGKRKINKREPQAPPAKHGVPSHLTPLEAEFWQQIFPIVSAMRIMTSGDVLALEQLCRFLAEERECTEQLAEEGRLIDKVSAHGETSSVLNPIARLRSDAARHIRSYLAVFGLGPSFRAALQTDPSDDPPQDPLENVRRAKTASDRVQ